MESVIQQNIIRLMTNVPHRPTEDDIRLHQEALQENPLFYAQAAVFAQDSKIRDNQALFVATLLASDIPLIRSVGLAIFEENVLGNIRLMDQVLQLVSLAKNGMRYANIKDTQSGGRSKRTVDLLYYSVPKSVRTSVKRWLNSISADRIDRIYSSDRKSFTNVVRGTNVPRTRMIKRYMDGDYPEGSRASVISSLMGMSPENRANAIVQNNISYLVARPACGPNPTPAEWYALISVATPAQLLKINNSLTEAGVFNNDALRELYTQRTTSKKAAKRLSTAQVEAARGRSSVQADKIKETRRGSLSLSDTVLAFDISSSMQNVVELSRVLLGELLPLVGDDRDSYAYFYNHNATRILIDPSNQAQINTQTALMRATGMTSSWTVIEDLLAKGITPKRIVFITDGGDNRWNLPGALSNFESRNGYVPEIYVIKTRRFESGFVRSLQQAGIVPTEFDWGGDLNAVDDMVNFVCGRSLVEVISEIQLPTCKRVSI